MVEITAMTVIGSLLKLAHRTIFEKINEGGDVRDLGEIRALLGSVDAKLDKIVESLDRLAKSVEGVQRAIDHVSDTILHVATYGPSIEAGGHIQLALRALNAEVYDITIEELGKAEKLDKTDASLWIAFLLLRLKLMFSNVGETKIKELIGKIEHDSELEIERAYKFVMKNTEASPGKEIVLFLYYILEISVFLGQYHIARTLIAKISNTIVSTKVLTLANSQIYLRPLADIVEGIETDPAVSSSFALIREQLRTELTSRHKAIASQLAAGYTVHGINLEDLKQYSAWFLAKTEIDRMEITSRDLPKILVRYNYIVKAQDDIDDEIEKKDREHDIEYAFDRIFSKLGCLPMFVIFVLLPIGLFWIEAPWTYIILYTAFAIVSLIAVSNIMVYVANSEFRRFRRERLSSAQHQILELDDRRRAELEGIRATLAAYDIALPHDLTRQRPSRRDRDYPY